jgi:OOP family OmpA-OmpF porin
MRTAKEATTMKKRIPLYVRIAAPLALGLAATGAQAQFYIGGGIGQDNARMPSVSQTVNVPPAVVVTGSGSNKTDTSYKLYGGYQFTPHWGAELGYSRLGDHTANITVGNVAGSGSYSLESWTLAGTGTLPLGASGFSLLGKLGVAANRISGSNFCVAGFCDALGSERKTNAFWGVGAEYAFTRQISARLEWEDYGKFTGNDVWGTGGSGAIKASAWNASVKFKF